MSGVRADPALWYLRGEKKEAHPSLPGSLVANLYPAVTEIIFHPITLFLHLVCIYLWPLYLLAAAQARHGQLTKTPVLPSFQVSLGYLFTFRLFLLYKHDRYRSLQKAPSLLYADCIHTRPSKSQSNPRYGHLSSLARLEANSRIEHVGSAFPWKVRSVSSMDSNVLEHIAVRPRREEGFCSPLPSCWMALCFICCLDLGDPEPRGCDLPTCQAVS